MNVFRSICLLVAIGYSGLALSATPVSVKTVRYADVAYQPVHTTAAEVNAKHDSTISAEISAVVINVKHDTGDKVNAGDTIIELDCRTHKLQLQQAKANHDAVVAQHTNAKKLFESAKKLQKQNNISRELYNQREADAARLKAESLGSKAGIESAKIAVEKCNIIAPYDGYISERFISKGEHAQPGTPVFQMITSAKGRVEAHINTFQYDSFINGEDFQFVYDGLSYDIITDSILPVLDKTYRTHTARLTFTENPAPTGSHGELKWKDSQLAVPSNMVVVRNKQAGVLVADNSKARFVAVDSYTEGHPAFVTLEPDTQIITIGRHGLKSGDAIMISP